MFGVEWVWRWSFTGPDAITALCPSCKNELGQPHNGEFACSNCHRQYRTDLAHSYMADHGQEIEKEIRRRCRTGEWKGAPQRLKKPETRAAGH
ncbi:MAG: hypothetical protein HKN10_05330 [Myxococcales bacterium]|nr:hypothetical protein [Myxococcales bacterium]